VRHNVDRAGVQIDPIKVSRRQLGQLPIRRHCDQPAPLSNNGDERVPLARGRKADLLGRRLLAVSLDRRRRGDVGAHSPITPRTP
jgi:hypothetical protein